MADIQINKPECGPGIQVLINGVDYSMEVFRDFEIVEVGDDPAFAEVGFRVTFAVSRLGIDTVEDVELTDHVPAVAAKVRSMTQDEEVA